MALNQLLEKRTLLKNHTLIYFRPRCLRGAWRTASKCSNLEQITLEMGEPDLAATKRIYHITE